MKTWVYVDGLNLYYGAVKGTAYKWLDPVRLTRLLLPQDHVVDQLKYFTALVSGKPDPKAPVRQRTYLKALATQSEISVHRGHFITKTVWRPLSNLPVAGQQITSIPDPVTLSKGNHTVSGNSRVLPVGDPDRSAMRKDSTGKPTLIAEFQTAEEKGTDVNLAAHLLNDAWKKMFDAAVVISNDTDLVTPIRMVTSERKKSVFVVCPGQRKIAEGLEKAATHVRHIRTKHLKKAQFPDILPGTKISKPRDW